MSSKKSSVLNQSPYNSLYQNPLNELKMNQNRENGDSKRGEYVSLKKLSFTDNKENAVPDNNKMVEKKPVMARHKENVVPLGVSVSNNIINDGSKENQVLTQKSNLSSSADYKKKKLKPTSLQLCMQYNEPDSSFGLKIWDPLELDNENPSNTNGNNSKANMWDFSDSEAAPASSWSTLPNRSLLCRPLPQDIGRCTCVIVKETAPLEGFSGGSFYSLYTNEGQGRQDRKLAVAHHRSRNGKTEFVIAQNAKGLLCRSDDSYLGNVNANFMGSKYHIWDKGNPLDSLKQQSKLLLAVVAFVPTITTCTGSYRSLRAWIPKHQSAQLKNTTQIEHVKGLPKDWEGKMSKSHQLFSRIPHYNKFSKQYELDFRERGRGGLRIQRSSKNFQLTLEENGRHSILQLGRVGKTNFVMDYRYPLTAYQAFCISLASIDSKLCCTI
ncbi:hypothetical protein MKW92_017444 [Papaver armeniacum]|nr:hypothetical protein MKW92_017444 [Papaver armeniacum]